MTDPKPFAPKDAETLKSELLELHGIDYETNEAFVDAQIERELKSEEMKASLHEQKVKAQEAGKIKEVEEVAKAPKPKGTSEGYSLKDIRALGDVHDDDVDELTEFAKFKGISISEAKAKPAMKALLTVNAEERATAAAANTGTTKRGKKDTSDESVLRDFENGTVPESKEDIDKLVRAQFEQRKARAKRN